MTSAQPRSFRELANFFPRQLEAVDAIKKFTYTLYGGAAGGGKSRLLRWVALYLVLWYTKAYNVKGLRVGLFCEDYPALHDRHLNKIPFEFPSFLGTLNKSTHEFTLHPDFGSGVIAFRNLDDPSKYLSSEFAAILVDELTRNTREIFDFLLTRLRWPGVPNPKFIAATNPGGAGHGYVKKLWIDRDFTDEAFNPDDFAFVQSKASDNPHIDPSYQKQLASLPEQLRRAYLDGDWDIFKGQFFTEFRRSLHVIEPFQDEDTQKWFNTLPTYVGLDYGYSAPSAVLWAKFHADNVYIYRELYVTNKTFEELRDLIMRAEYPHIIYADPSIWAKKDSPHSGAEKMRPLPLKQAMNDRILGWNFLKQAFKSQSIKIFSNCTNLIRTIPVQVYDTTHTEDLDTTAEDHLADALRYLIATHKQLTPQKSPLNYANLHQKNKSDIQELFKKPPPKHPINVTYAGHQRTH